MKRLTALILLAVLLLSAAGCAGTKEPPKKTAAFYYRTAETAYDGKTGILGSEERESAGYGDDMVQLLNVYFRGPVSETLLSPFPPQVKAVGYAVLGSTVMLELSSEFAQLSGIDLTIACACIASTIFDLVEQDRIQISTTDSLLDGQSSITIERSSMLLVDTPAKTDATAETSTGSTQ